mmetsp:Transcript_3856/g.8995  ORF Transcript_3856/g.8995 Transcript_3856/m.8995 type:complete len:83 (-) Transcript_3856:25-273(-)
MSEHQGAGLVPSSKLLSGGAEDGKPNPFTGVLCFETVPSTFKVKAKKIDIFRFFDFSRCYNADLDRSGICDCVAMVITWPPS